jgi:tetratricopeptide (TPR) repeat protein
MVLAPATGVFGLYGFSGRPERERELLDLMDRLAPHYGEDWWFLGQHAFAECEYGRLGPAEVRFERALALNPASGHIAHVRAQVHYELGQNQAAAQFLAGWLPGYPRSGQLHCHISWHAAMCAMMLGDADRALEILSCFTYSVTALAPHPQPFPHTWGKGALWRNWMSPVT